MLSRFGGNTTTGGATPAVEKELRLLRRAAARRVRDKGPVGTFSFDQWTEVSLALLVAEGPKDDTGPEARSVRHLATRARAYQIPSGLATRTPNVTPVKPLKQRLSEMVIHLAARRVDGLLLDRASTVGV